MGTNGSIIGTGVAAALALTGCAEGTQPAEVQTVLPSFEIMLDENRRPLEMTYDQATRLCEDQGLKLPSMSTIRQFAAAGALNSLGRDLKSGQFIKVWTHSNDPESRGAFIMARFIVNEDLGLALDHTHTRFELTGRETALAICLIDEEFQTTQGLSLANGRLVVPAEQDIEQEP